MGHPTKSPPRSTQTLRSTQLALKLFFVLICLVRINQCESNPTRSTKVVMLSMNSRRNANCLDQSITVKNQTSSVILTGTVLSCDMIRGGSYKCKVQIWRIMKGKLDTIGLITVENQDSLSFMYKKSFADVYGMGNIAYCESDVNKDDTRIMFLNRTNNRLVLSASLVHITLSNLKNTQAVIEGKRIVETPKKKPDPCMKVLCGYGATCIADKAGNATCLCPSTKCVSLGETEIFAPVCGSNGVTYPNQCRLNAAQCILQRRIRVAETDACAPVLDESLCVNETCGNAAVCVVRIQPDGSSAPSCVCPICDDSPIAPLCGSDGLTHRSLCDMQRQACTKNKIITVVRNSACDPCTTFNSTSDKFELSCTGVCSMDELDQPLCCDDIKCLGKEQLVCGSDGNTYESQCALERYSCKFARKITMLTRGRCPDKKRMTTVRGSVAIQSSTNCPGNCVPESEQFQSFISNFEMAVNKDLQRKAFQDIDSRTLGEFKITASRTGSVILLFRAYASTAQQPIGINDAPESVNSWIFNRLFDPSDGAVYAAATTFGVSLVDARHPKDDFFVEDVCLSLQCEFGAMCHITKSGVDFIPSCACDQVGNGDILPVTHACKLASDGVKNDQVFHNRQAARYFSCSTASVLTFEDVCFDILVDPCDTFGGCNGEGQFCVIINGHPMCDCITCSNVYKPVCTSDDETFRSSCEVHRYNCMSGSSLNIIHDGPCTSKCDGVKCWPGAQCEVNSQGATCVCPTMCVETISPVCGSDDVTYSNRCKMVISSCKSRTDITIQHTGPCDTAIQSGEGETSEGSGTESGNCNCQYGATCNTTMDDEDSHCLCDINCSNISPGAVCGTDGITYLNACELLKSQCEKQKLIKVAAAGPCKTACVSSAYGCCQDGLTAAKGLQQVGCPEKCACNEFGSFEATCHPKNGQCVCRPGIEGLKCDRCQPGFWNFHAVANGQISGCMACNCNPLGSTRDDCDQMTGRCSCKDNVFGGKCTHCRQGDNLTWITNEMCEKVTSTPTSCSELSCRAGQECVAVDGTFECRCPTLTSCNSFRGSSVCGSNGITYPNACQMRVITCKQGMDVKIVSKGICAKTTPLEKSVSLLTDSPQPSTRKPYSQLTTYSMREPVLTTSQVAPTSIPFNQPQIITRSMAHTSTVEHIILPEVGMTTKMVSVSLSTNSEPAPNQTLNPQTVTHSMLTTEQKTVADQLPSIKPEAFTESELFTKRKPFTEPNASTEPTAFTEQEASTEPKPVPEQNPYTRPNTVTELEPSTEPKPVTEPEPSSETKPVTKPKPSSEPNVATPSEVPESSGSDGCIGDDEDCETGSGLNLSTNKPEDVFATTNELRKPTEAPLLFNGTAEFYKIDSDTLTYTSDLEDPTSEIFAEYSNLINLKVMKLAVDQSLHGKVNAFSIKSFQQQPWTFWVPKKGLIVSFELSVTPGTNPIEIETALNHLTNNANTFHINRLTGGQTDIAHDWPYTSTEDAADPVDAFNVPIPKYKQIYEGPSVPPIVYQEGVQWTIPQFGGASYAKFAKMDSATSTTIVMRFRSFDSDGLLFYAGNTNSDFISLGVNKGYVEFRFDTGTGPFVLRHKKKVDDANWHKIFARRNRREGFLQIDDYNPVEGSSPGLPSVVNLNSHVFIGGYENNERIRKQTGVNKGLTGCIYNTSLDDTSLGLNCTIQSHRIAECGSSPCFPNKCKNSASCFISNQNNVFTNKCVCKRGWQGTMCEKPTVKERFDPCVGHNCHYSSSCVTSKGGDGYTCLCPTGRTGTLCMDGDNLSMVGPDFMPAFAEDSYLQYESLVDSDVSSSFNIQVWFYSSQPNGLILYNGQKKQSMAGRRDFVALNLNQGHLVFLYDLGQGIAKIRSATTLALNEWHVAQVSRNLRHGQMTVDGGSPVSGESPRLWYWKHKKEHSQLNIDQPLYLGGVPDYSKLPKESGITTGLVGSLQKFEVNGISWPLRLDANITHYNVQAFNAHACYHRPCENGGTCYPRGAQFNCACAPGYVGSRCDQKATDRRDSDAVLSDQAAPAVRFNGKTKAVYRNAVKDGEQSINWLPESRAAKHNAYGLVIRTTARHGLLLLAGKAVDNSDYLAIVISDGRLHLQFNLGSGPTNVISDERIDDGTLTTISVERKFNTATLQVNNGMPKTVTAIGNTRELNTDGMVWLGGIDYHPRGVGLYKSFFQPFTGCITSFRIHDKEVDLVKDALNYTSFFPCFNR